MCLYFFHYRSLHRPNSESCSDTNMDEDDEEEADSCSSNSGNEANRVKYLEKMQANQFELMSQLISAIGSTNKNNSATHVIAEPKVVTSETMPSQVVASNATLKKSQCATKKKTKISSQSRSRSRSRTKVSAVSPARSITGAVSSCGVCDRSRSASRSSNGGRRRSLSKKRNSQFLEELLDSAKSPNVSQVNLEAKRATNAMSNEMLVDDYDTRPVLFDRYLVIKATLYAYLVF